MKRPNRIFWIGLSFFIVSFFLTAIAGSEPSYIGSRGYNCAWNVIWASLDVIENILHISSDPTFSSPFERIAILDSGLINPVFIVTAVLLLTKRSGRLVAGLRFVVVAMIPLCWVVFHYESMYPREGHFFWILGMVLVLFSNNLEGLFAQKSQTGNG